MTSGPLAGCRIIEIGSAGAGPFAAMLLSDMGAEVLRVDRNDHVRAEGSGSPAHEPMNRGRQSVAIDLKHPDGAGAVLRLIEQSDALLEGFRPGIMERLGLGPQIALGRSPRLVYCRLTGFGQDGPYAHAPGHDINYISLAGALHGVGRAGTLPVPPMNLIADFGGGGMLAAFGIVCGILESRASGQGQVIDAAMVDGSALLMTAIFGERSKGRWQDERGVNIIDSGAPFYEVYETADGRYVSVAAAEPKFYRALLELLDVAPETLPPQFDPSGWPQTKQVFAGIFRQRTRDEWCALAEGSEACITPVLTMGEAPLHPHNVHRGTFIAPGGVLQAAPAPRFSRTPGSIQRPPSAAGQHTLSALRTWGFSKDEIDALEAGRAIASPHSL
jgi:alpha-methylacyl-CoA racemase